MQGLLFVSQPVLDGWVEAGRADVDADGLHLADAVAIGLTPAFRVLEVLEGSDAEALVGKVQTEAALRALGGEPFGDSLLLGEVVYTVEPGFVAALPVPEGMAAGAAAVAGQGAEPRIQPPARQQTQE